MIVPLAQALSIACMHLVAGIKKPHNYEHGLWMCVKYELNIYSFHIRKTQRNCALPSHLGFFNFRYYLCIEEKCCACSKPIAREQFL